ncbi:hypothetical protein MKW92_017804 [Papaver armeniacum]|nr:hypothetical protein MKW92_017804 [Papaver armeniacum]
MTTLLCNVSNRAHGLCNEPEIWRNEGIPRDGFRNMVGMRCNKRVGRRYFVLKASSSGYQKVENINGRKVNETYIERTYDRAQESNSWDGAPVHERLFVIRSYEIGHDKTFYNGNSHESAGAETAPNHVMSSSLAGDGFGATHEMSLRKLIWVVTRIHIQVNTWVDAAGKNGMRREWEIRDNKTQQIITRATRCRTSEARGETLLPNRAAMGEAIDDRPKLISSRMKPLESIRSGLAVSAYICLITTIWSDMYANQHVNNVKYIGWILESVPINVLEDYNLISMTLEFRRECRQSNLLESSTHMEVIETEETTNSESKTKADFRSTHS